MCPQPLRWNVLFLAVLLGFSVGTVRAEVKEVPLNGTFSNFAFNPRTGDVLAVNAEKSEVQLIRWVDVQAGNFAAAEVIKVGPAPGSAVYKRYGDLELFVVVCMNVSHMYLLDATSGNVLKKIELEPGGARTVISSLNPDDPFVYYTYPVDNGRNTSRLGVVSLRDSTNKGHLLDGFEDGGLSTSGDMLYRRQDSGHPNRESLLRINQLTDGKPEFVRMRAHFGHTYPVVPDAFDQFSASANVLFNRSLREVVKEIGISPQCFFRKRPIMMAAQVNEDIYKYQSTFSIHLHAASYNTLRNVGKPFVKKGLPGTVVGRESPPHWWKHKTFADDDREQVVFAVAQRIYYLPLADFQIPDEPMLMATLAGPTQLIVDQPATWNLTAVDPRTEVSYENLPTGMIATGTTLTWRPTGAQIGPLSLRVQLKLGELERVVSFDLDVRHPTIELPFIPAGGDVSRNGALAAVWEGIRPDEYGRRLPANRDPKLQSFRISVVNLDNGSVVAEQTQPDPLDTAQFVDDSHVVFWSTAERRRYHLLDVNNGRAIVLDVQGTNPVFRSLGNLLAIQSAGALWLYDLAKLELISRTHGLEIWDSPHHLPGLTSGGFRAEFGLLDYESKPILLLQPLNIPWMPGAEAGWQPSFLPAPQPTFGQIPRRPVPTPTAAAASGPEIIRNGQLQFTADLKHHLEIERGGSHADGCPTELVVVASGAVEAQQTLLRLHRPALNLNPRFIPLLRGFDNGVVAIFENYLARWALLKNEEQITKSQVPLGFVPQQSALALSGTGKLVLKHEVSGGDPTNLKFDLISPYDAIIIDERTGDVTIDETRILPDAAKAVEKWVVKQAHGQSYVETLRSRVEFLSSQAEKLLGRRPRGAPVAIPIHVTVSNGNVFRDRLQYYVIAEAPSGPLLARLAKLDAERPSAAPPGSNANTKSTLQDRVGSLEKKLEAVTSQLNEVLKREDQLRATKK